MKKRILSILLTCLLIGASGCGKQPDVSMTSINSAELNIIDDKYRTFYEVFVYSYADSNEDGIGDFAGLTEKLDYIQGDLGCNGIWLMPIMPSKTYHKYDVTDYMGIDSQYGTMEEFDTFMEECKKRDVHVILDLVMNHTSSAHPWFTEACDYLKQLGDEEPSEKDCPHFGYYHFTKETGKKGYYQVPGTSWYYEGAFWSEMPDLDMTNPLVREEFDAIVKFWLDKGVEGFRIDAAKEFEPGNTTQNVEILSWLNDTVKGYKEDAYIVAEVWTAMDSFAPYYASGIDSVFNFAFADTSGVIVKTLRGDASLYGKNIVRAEELFKQYNTEYIDAPFYTNHDLARGAGYFAGEKGGKQVKMAQGLNLMMSGNAFLYYGEEIGMKGSGKDENKRAPMYWAKENEAKEQCEGPKDMESFEMLYPSLKSQKEDENSIYTYVREAVKLRNQFPEIARGTTEYFPGEKMEDVGTLKKTYGEEEMLILYNVSEEAAAVSLGAYEINGEKGSQGEIVGALLTGAEIPDIEGENCILPSYSIVLIK